ncbi:DUF2934 domain-containing protein [Rhizobium sp. GN54]|uniref:DUF2934 domain-containing protein n=1 Tax=Rhizobium sp. GN54 TaxID=2898150 RepID=UPI0022A8EAB4|nr:DUF2934 domain-containing protein [Rhizobium sp. GN54]
MTNGSEKQDLIRKKAYAIWETEGRPHGQDERHWQQAEAEIETSSPAARPAPRKAAATKAAAPKPTSLKPVSPKTAAPKPATGKAPAKRRTKAATDPA